MSMASDNWLDVLREIVLREFSYAAQASKLELLKRQIFTLAGKEQRVAASLAALNAPQPTDLTLEQWKEIIKEVEDEED